MPRRQPRASPPTGRSPSRRSPARSAPRSAASTCPRTSTTTSSPRSAAPGSRTSSSSSATRRSTATRSSPFARRIGTPVEYPFVPGFDGYPEIIAVTKLPHETVNFGGIWHSDTAYLDEPPMATMLLAREVPRAGGDTMFANMYAAYEALSPAMQELLDPLRASTARRSPTSSKTREDRIRDGGSAERVRDVRGVASGRADASRDRAQGAVRQRRPHGAVRRDDRGGEPAAAAVPLPAPGASRSSRADSAGRSGR